MKSYTVVSRALLYVEAQGLDVIVLNGPVGSNIYIYQNIWTFCDSIVRSLEASWSKNEKCASLKRQPARTRLNATALFDRLISRPFVVFVVQLLYQKAIFCTRNCDIAGFFMAHNGTAVWWCLMYHLFGQPSSSKDLISHCEDCPRGPCFRCICWPGKKFFQWKGRGYDRQEKMQWRQHYRHINPQWQWNGWKGSRFSKQHSDNPKRTHPPSDVYKKTQVWKVVLPKILHIFSIHFIP